MLRAITFDFWGTLVDAGATYNTRTVRIEALAQRLPGTSPESVAAAYDGSWRDFALAMDQGYGVSTATRLSGTLDILGVALSPSDWTAISRHWQETFFLSPPPLLEGVPQVLRALRGRGLLVGLISDTVTAPGSLIRRMLSQAGIRALFDWLTFSDEIGVTKRRPQPFTSTLKALGVAPGQAMHVGDLPETDIRGAQAVGMYAALLLENSQRRDGIPEADLVLERLRDLPMALEEWEKSGGE